METKWEAKNFHKNFHNVLERGGGVEIKHHITYFVNKSNYDWPLKKKWKNYGPPLIQAVLQAGDRFWVREIGAQKMKNQFFFRYILYSLKSHAHYFTVFIYLETWGVLNLVLLLISFSQTYPDTVKVWTHWYMYTVYRSLADQSRDHIFSYYHRPKIFSVLPPDGSSFLVLELPPISAGFPLGQGSQGIC